VHGSSLYTGYYDNGKQVKERIGPKGLVTKGQAEQAFKARMGEIVQGRFKLAKINKTTSLKNLIDKYLKRVKHNKKSSKREVFSLRLLLDFI